MAKIRLEIEVRDNSAAEVLKLLRFLVDNLGKAVRFVKYQVEVRDA